MCTMRLLESMTSGAPISWEIIGKPVRII